MEAEAMEAEVEQVAEEGSSLLDELVRDIMVRVRNDNGNALLVRCTEVCKQWKEAARFAVSQFTWTCDTRPLPAAMETSKYAKLRSVKFDRCTVGRTGWPLVFEALGAGCPRLDSLHMTDAFPPLTTDDITSLFSNSPHLRTLRLVNSLAQGVTLFPDHMPSLEHLHISATSTSNNDPSVCVSLPTLEPLTRLSTLSFQHLPTRFDLPPLSTLTNLCQLSFFFCEQLPSEIVPVASLHLLEVLDLDGCESLRGLPPLGHLQHLHSLLLNGCNYLESAAGIEHLTQLRALDLSNCIRLRDLGRLTALRALEKLGLDIIVQERATWVLEWLPQLASLKLAFFYVNGSLNIRTLRLPVALLYLEICSSMNDIHNLTLAGATNLCRLEIDSSITLAEQSAWPTVHAFSLSLFSGNIRESPSPDAFPNLRELTVSQSDDTPAVDLPWPNLPRTLTSVTFARCDERPLRFLEHLPNLQHLTLDTLDMQRFPRNFFSLGSGFERLSRLVIEDCDALDCIPELGHLSALRYLKISRCGGLEALPELSALTDVEELHFTRLPELASVPDLDGLTSLRKLKLWNCRNLAALPLLQRGCWLTALEDVSLAHCSGIEALPPMCGLVRLRALNLYGCSGLRRLPQLDGLTRLLWLDLGLCIGLRPRIEEAWPLTFEGMHPAFTAYHPDDEGDPFRTMPEHPAQTPFMRWRSWRVGDEIV